MVQFYTQKKSSRAKQFLELTIDSLDQFGQGVAHSQGKICFIAGALPGERIRAEVLVEKRSFIQAKVKQILQSSPERITPTCPVYERCGGCQQQHLLSNLQQQAKQQALAHLLHQATGQFIEVETILAGSAWQYRRRTRISLRWDRQQQVLQFGFREQGSEQIVSVSQCPVLVPELDALLVPLQQCLRQLDMVQYLGHVELVAADNGVYLTLRYLRDISNADQLRLEQFAHQYQLALYLVGQQSTQVINQTSQPWYRVADCQLYFQPQNFIQVNAEVNELMVIKALEWLALRQDDRVLDLFCGMGNFSLPIAKNVNWVTGVEGVEALVKQAEYNAVINRLTNVDFWQQDLEQDISQQSWARQGYNKILLDPARAGAAGIIPHIVRLMPERVVYISCNPATLARDSEILFKSSYRIAKVAMLDMFPHTRHLESMVLFSQT